MTRMVANERKERNQAVHYIECSESLDSRLFALFVGNAPSLQRHNK